MEKYQPPGCGMRGSVSALGQETTPQQMLQQKRLEAISRQGEAGELATELFIQSLDTFAQLYAIAPELVSLAMHRLSSSLRNLVRENATSRRKKQGD
jgi:hypothetical protein